MQQLRDAEDQAVAAPVLAIAKQVEAQDVQISEEGTVSLIKESPKIDGSASKMGKCAMAAKVAACVSMATSAMCFTTWIVVIRAAGLTAANVPEASVTPAISADLAQQAVTLSELHIDRAYLSSHLVRERSPELQVYCKAWPVRQGKRFHKQAFALDWEQQIIRCPAEIEMPFVPGGVSTFPSRSCAHCPLQAQCTTSQQGRSVQHPSR